MGQGPDTLYQGNSNSLAEVTGKDPGLGSRKRGGRDLDSLEYPIPGIPGEDYPIYGTILDTGFSCDGQVHKSVILSVILNSVPGRRWQIC